MYRNFFDYHTLNDEDTGRNAWEETKVVDGPGNDEETFPQFGGTCNVCTRCIPAGQPGYEKLHKIKSLLGLLFRNFERAYNLYENISIDEGMIPWRGRLSFRQLIASKPIRFDIKVWVLADLASK